MSAVSRRVKETYTVVVRTLHVEQVLAELMIWFEALYNVFMRGDAGEDIEKICAPSVGFHNSGMTLAFAKSLRKSKLLESQTQIVFGPRAFDTDEMVSNIVQAKKWGKDAHPILIANISHCLHSLRVVSLIHSKIMELSQTQFDKKNDDHVELLNRFWKNMKPNTTRTGGLVTDEWSEVGFQGKDPSSDFRGMGLLGLIQLTYFSTHRTDAAIEILRESNHERRFFPFAATGINMTNFVMELLSETRCHKMLFDHLELNSLSDLSTASYGPETSNDTINGGCEVIHSLFCKVYEDFVDLWVKRDPRDIMSFGTLFNEVKQQYRKRYQ